MRVVPQLTSQITDAVPVVLNLKQERRRGVRCICFVRHWLLYLPLADLDNANNWRLSCAFNHE